MKFSLPFYIQGSARDSSGSPSYTVRLLFGQLFGQDWEITAPLLDKAWQLALQRVHHFVAESRREPTLEQLTPLTYAPRVSEQMVTFQLEHQKKFHRCRFLVVVLKAMGQRLAFVPHLPFLWFTWDQGQHLDTRAGEALRVWLRQQARSGQEYDMHQLTLGESVRAWIQVADFEIPAPGTSKPSTENTLMAILGASPASNGARELQNVGRDLDRENIERPTPFVGREQELESLLAWRLLERRSALAVVGPSLVGKSALVQSMIQRYSRWQQDQPQSRTPPPNAKKKKGNKAVRGRHWLLAPGRLISGMSYIGQWENRLLSILRYARQQDLVLVFDDLVGLLTAGQSRDSSLNVGQVLKSFMVRGDIRVLAQATAEEFQILRERDRALADLFELCPVQPSPSGLTRQVAVAVARHLEDTQSVRLEMEAVHLSVELADRYLTGSSQPGKSARLLTQLAARYRQESIDESRLLDWFSRSSGLRPVLIDRTQSLTEDEVRLTLADQIRGQEPAVETCVEVVSILRARLSLGGRPLASLLFVGPTGVGKTECAKALASYLFGSSERLLRFDMNEFLGPDSVARLVGTFDRPEGLLTEAVRSQPFSVILLDEIEKAHSSVLLLLLQVLGDGRLSDARGRTVDLSQSIIVMTSNLGADQVSKNLGLRHRRHQDELVYRRAVQEFFPPELFNRIDRIVPFRSLDRDTVAEIAERMWHRMLAREGFRRRQCLLEVDGQVQQALVEAGFHPDLGARALKRAVEEKIVAPVAQRLARLPLEGLVLLRIDAALQVSVLRLEPLSAAPINRYWDEVSSGRDPAWVSQELQAAPAKLTEDSKRLQSWRSRAALDNEYLFFELQEELRQLGETARALGSLAKTDPSKRRIRPGVGLSFHWLNRTRLETLLTSEDLYSSLQKCRAKTLENELTDSTLQNLGALDWWRRRFHHAEQGFEEQVVSARWSGPSALCRQLSQWMGLALNHCGIDSTLGTTSSKQKSKKPQKPLMEQSRDLELPFQARGLGAEEFFQTEFGLHLFVSRHGFRTLWLEPQGQSLRAQERAPIVRIYCDDGLMLDLASGVFSVVSQPQTAKPDLMAKALTCLQLAGRLR